ncbi:hypothetical protein HDU98_003644 [Podochytrium sp. JEL0797]|nr:hypothetical protein HDU98_003644 [Podochytrium sp. JEL0797]
MSPPSLALRNARVIVEAVNTKNFDLLSSVCDKSVFVYVTRPSSLGLPDKSLAEFVDSFAMFETVNFKVDEDELYEVQQGENAVVISHATASGVVAGVTFVNEYVNITETNKDGLVVRVVQFCDSHLAIQFYTKLGMI